MVPTTGGLQVGLVPHQGRVASVWHDMVDTLRHGSPAYCQAAKAKRVGLTIAPGEAMPRVVVAPSLRAAPLLLVGRRLRWFENGRTVGHELQPITEHDQ